MKKRRMLNFLNFSKFEWLLVLLSCTLYTFICSQIVYPGNAIVNFQVPKNDASLIKPAKIECPEKITLMQGEMQIIKPIFLGENNQNASNKYRLVYDYETHIFEINITSMFELEIYGLYTGECSCTIVSIVDENVFHKMDIIVEPNYEQNVSNLSFVFSTTNLDIGDSGVVLHDAEPYYASSNIKYESSNPSIVTIDKNGYYKANKSGNSSIKVLLDNEIIFDQKLEVSETVSQNSYITICDDYLTLVSGNKYNLINNFVEDANTAFTTVIKNDTGTLNIYGNTIVPRRVGNATIEFYSLEENDLLGTKTVSIVSRDLKCAGSDATPLIYFTYDYPIKFEYNNSLKFRYDAAAKINIKFNIQNVYDPLFIYYFTTTTSNNDSVEINHCGMINSKSANQEADISVSYLYNGEQIINTFKINSYIIYDANYANKLILNSFIYFLFFPLSFFSFSFLLLVFTKDQRFYLKLIFIISIGLIPATLSIIFKTFVLQDYLTIYASILSGCLMHYIFTKCASMKNINKIYYEIEI